MQTSQAAAMRMLWRRYFNTSHVVEWFVAVGAVRNTRTGCRKSKEITNAGADADAKREKDRKAKMGSLHS
jgi:hypothetical protein